MILPSVVPAKFGIPLYPNCNIVFQIHYPKGTIGQLDSTKVRIFLYPTSETNIREVYTVPLLQNWSLNIPAGTVQTYTNECPTSGIFNNCKFYLPITVLSANPHQHLIGKNIVNFAVSPTFTDTVKLIRINDWNFNWQGYYFYKKPVIIPANYKWTGIHTYDNTASNPNNPFNPPQNIYAGYQTSDEMFFDSFMFTIYQPGDENLNIDSLMTVSVKEFTRSQHQYSPQMVVYPNPADKKIQVTIFPPIQGKSEITLYDINGRKILESTTYSSETELNVDTYESGFYFIEWKNSNNHLHLKEKILIQKK